MERTLIKDTTSRIGETVLLKGWVTTRRDHGKIVFLDLRDRWGMVQVVATAEIAGEVNSEWVVAITGKVKARPEKLINEKIATGRIEVEAEKVEVLSKAKTLPLPIDTDGYDINEESRLKYRYLDLRRERLQRNIALRSKFVDLARQFLFSRDFLEIETPILTKSTPEGSRDFLVPSRLQPGKFYALPQSPQQYKQLLMASGFERYFQIARCIRDEDLRADRGFEHTQIDIEMSFVNREDVMRIDEEMMITVTEQMGMKIKQKPFPIITYQESMKKFGKDKFDLRDEQDKKDGVLAFAWVIDFPFFEKTDEGGWTFTHNPFSAPKPEYKEMLMGKKNIGEILTTQYDLVCNGYEVGGGSIRSHEPEMLEKVFEVMGYENEAIHEKFGHMLEAFSYGIPPHGGLAHGVERLLMTVTGEPYLREVVAFPMTSNGQTSVMSAPSEVDQKQLDELGISAVSGFATEGTVYEKIISLLDKNKAKYKTFEHEAVFTSEQAVKVRGTELKQGAKALVMFGDKKPLMIVLPANLKADLSKFKKLYGIKDLRMATAEEVKKLTNTEVGAVPPFGNLFKLPVFVDKMLGENQEIAFNAGEHTRSIKMFYEDYKSITKPTIGDFAS